MKAIRLITVAFCLSLLSSCALIGSILKIPVSILSTVGRTVGVVHLTDDKAQPVEDHASEEVGVQKESSSE